MVGDVILGAGPGPNAAGSGRWRRFPAFRWCDLNIPDRQVLLRE